MKAFFLCARHMFDLDYISNNQFFIAGCDEVGRGPLAGPVVACCVFVDLKKCKKPESLFGHLQDLGVTDSKMLSEKRRLGIINDLKISKLEAHQNCAVGGAFFSSLSFRIEEISALEIDKINILQASLLGMKRAYLSLQESYSHEQGVLLIDGNKKIDEKLGLPIIKGDSKSLVIGLASVIAKVYRDSLMKDFGILYPQYGFEKHAGYPTKKHCQVIRQIGPCPIHRKTFKGVKEYL